MKLITLKKITLHNFMAYRDIELDFHGKDIVGILAEYEDDSTRSNRGGKCFAAGTSMLMFDGTNRNVEDIKTGDLLIGPDSLPRKVGTTTTGVEEMFLVEANDGDISFKCNKSHILSLKTSTRVKVRGVMFDKNSVINLTVGEYAALPEWLKPMFNLYRSNAIELKKVKLPLDPYVLGIWLGDGRSKSSVITTPEPEIFNYLKEFSEKNKTKFSLREYSQKNGNPYWDILLTGKKTGKGDTVSSTSVVSRTFKELNLFNNKHVPEIYLKSSIAQRLQLLAGLIDTDGHLSKNRFYEIVSKYETLKDAIVWLCRSLGLAVSVRVKSGTIDGKKVGDYFRINIYGDIGKIPCKVLRKKSEFKTTKRDVLRKGFKIESLGKGKYYGFPVNKDSLFLLSDFTVVHNSTLIEAIGYNLTGLSRTKDEAKLIHHGMKEMWVTGTYTDGERDYVVKRGRDHKSKGILEIDWFQKHSEAQEEIERLFGINAKDFHLTSYFKQADTEGFMKMKPTEKAAFLMQWLDNEHWREKEKLANEDRKVVKEKLRDNENLKKALEASLEIDESLVSDKYILERENKELSDKKTQISENLGVINNKLSNIQSEKNNLMSSIKKLNSEKTEIILQLDKLKDDSDAYTAHKQKYVSIKKSIDEIGELEDKKELVDTLDAAKQRRAEINTSLSISSKSTGMCPVLNEECDRVAVDEKKVEKLKREYESVVAAISNLSDQINKHDKLKNLTHDLEITQQKGARVKERLGKKSELEDRLKEILDKTLELNAANSALNQDDLTEEKETLNDEILTFNKIIKENGNKILDAEVRIAEAQRAKEKIDKVVESNYELQNKLSLLNYTCFMFSKNGIPALEIENSFQEIENNINYILSELLGSVAVSFSPDKEMKALEPVCVCGYQFPKGFRGAGCPECSTPRQKQRKEEISFKVIENGIEQDFEMDSGGGKQVISYAVRIALTMLKRAQRKCNLNMLFLDEVDSALDPYLASQIISSITNFLTKKLGYEQVILVSHKEQIKNSVPHIIKVTKHQDFSTARFI